MKRKKQNCIVFYAFDSEGKIKGVSCGKWSCEYCRKDLARMWSWRARIEVGDAQKTYWCWTLTLGGNYKTRQQGYAALKTLWDNLRKHIQRKLTKLDENKGKKWTYLAFVEEQPKQRKMPHFHILTNFKAPYRIKDFAVHHGFGFEATEKRVDGVQAANYVSKYTSKGDPNMPKNFRRVRASQNWAKLPAYEGGKLYVKSKNENLTHYLLRVEAATGIGVEFLYEQWKLMHEIDV